MCKSRNTELVIDQLLLSSLKLVKLFTNSEFVKLLGQFLYESKAFKSIPIVDYTRAIFKIYVICRRISIFF